MTAEESFQCQHCGNDGGTRQRQLTAYADDERNWATLCPECQEEANEYWKERWDDYYRELL